MLALSALAVIGYIFIIIYSNRKRYLGMGWDDGYVGSGTDWGSAALGRGGRDDDGRCKLFFVLVGTHVSSSSLRTVRDIHIQNHRALLQLVNASADISHLKLHVPW